jgi:hypothetical protein
MELLPIIKVLALAFAVISHSEGILLFVLAIVVAGEARV